MKSFADSYLDVALRYASVPVKQAVTQTGQLSIQLRECLWLVKPIISIYKSCTEVIKRWPSELLYFLVSRRFGRAFGASPGQLVGRKRFRDSDEVDIQLPGR